MHKLALKKEILVKGLNLLKKYLRNIPFVESSHKEIYRLFSIFVRKEHIAMFHTGRCGSTILGHMLNDHSKVFWAHEIFEKFMQAEEKERKRRIVEHIINQSRQSEIWTIYGFETKYLPQQHLSHKCINMDLEDYITLLRKLNFSKFIVLHRNNYLRRAISAQVGRHSKLWHSKQEVTSPIKINLDINSFVTGIRREPILELFSCMDKSFDRLKELLLYDDTLYLNYEDDILEDFKKEGESSFFRSK